MTNYDEERSVALVEFIQSFSTISEPIEQLQDLDDGVALFESLSEMYVHTNSERERIMLYKH
jgi:hypothetical protein